MNLILHSVFFVSGLMFIFRHLFLIAMPNSGYHSEDFKLTKSDFVSQNILSLLFKVITLSLLLSEIDISG